MHRKILVVLDTTLASRAAVIESIGFAIPSNAALHFFHVMPGFTPPASDPAAGVVWGLDDHLKEAHKTAAALVKAAMRDASIADVSATANAEFGEDPAESILREARRKGCDLIVIGSQGRTTIQRLIFGSVVTKLLTISHLPILACKQSNAPRAARSAVAKKRPTKATAASAIQKPKRPIQTPPRQRLRAARQSAN